MKNEQTQEQIDVREADLKMTQRNEAPKTLSEAVDRARGSNQPPSRPVRFSSWENCPLCNSTYVEVHEDLTYKPEVVCTDCGISLQGETVFELKERWNKRFDAGVTYATTEQEMPLCPVHKSLDESGTLALPYGNHCVACSLHERNELLDWLAPYADGDSINTLRKLVETHAPEGDKR